MDLERDRLRPQLEPQRQPSEPRVQRLEARQPETATGSWPPTSPPPPPDRPKSRLPWSWGRAAAIVLLIAAGLSMVGGSDDKVTPPPEPPSAASIADLVPDEIVVDLKDSAT